MAILSIIIPAYNVEDYLGRCVKSILRQSYKDFEIIIVNDGSTDNTENVAEELSKKDARVTFYNKQNGGLSDARNFGIKKSKGQYVSFVDSDDFILPNTYDKLMNQIKKKKLDIVISNAINQYPNGKRKAKNINKKNGDSKVVTGLSYLSNSIRDGSFTVVTVIGIYRKSLITSNDLYFKKGILHEDELWTPQILLAANRVQYLDLDFYVHYQRKGSITNRKDKKQNALDQVKISYSLNDIYRKLSITDELMNPLLDYTVSLYLSAYNMGKLYKVADFNKDIPFLIKNSKTLKNKLKTFLLSVNGKIYCKINEKINGKSD